MVEGTGQFALRGGILDLFVPDSENPVRVEFWGDEIDSINHFDILTQRRFDKVDSILLSPSNEILSEKIVKKANLLRSEKTEKAKETLYREAENIANGVNLTILDKYISLVYKKPATVLDYVDEEDFIFTCIGYSGRAALVRS